MQLFRLLHRRTKSEGDVSSLFPHPGSAAVTAPVFVPLQMSLPSFDPTRELYALHTDPPLSPVNPNAADELNGRIMQLESQLAEVQAENSTLEQDLADYRTDLLHTRTELYSEMLCSARQQQRTMDDFRTIQKLEERHQRFSTLLVDVGIPRSTVDVLCQAIQSGNGSPDDILVDAIKDASNNANTLLAKLQPIVKDERSPENYQSALNLTLSIRKELKSQKKRSKFWKKLAQEDVRHASTITPSPSDISSIRQDLSPERRSALDALIARRRAVKHPENTDSDVFGGRRRESALDTLASSLASRPRHSVQDGLRLFSSFSSSASSASTKYPSHFSVLSRIPVDPTAAETPVIPSRLPSPLSTSFRRSSRSASQSLVLGSVDLNVSRSSSIDPILPEETDQNANPDAVPVSMVTRSQDLLQNSRRASQGHGHRRVPSTASRPPSTRSARSSFRLSAFSPVRACRPIGPPTPSDMDISGNTTIDVPSFHTPDTMLRLSDLATTNHGSDTPALSETTQSEHTPFNDARALPKYGVDTPFSPTELAPQVASTPLDESVACKPLGGTTCTHNTRFLEHLDSAMSLTMSVSASDSGADARDGQERDYERDLERDREHNRAHTTMDSCTIPVGESKDSLFTTSASSLSAIETPGPTTPPTPSPSPDPDFCAASPTSTSTSTSPGVGRVSIARSMLPVLAKHLRRLSLSGTSPDRERLVDKLRGLRSLSRSRSGSRSSSGSGVCHGPGSSPVGMWRRSPARSDSTRSENTPSPSPVKGSGIPVLQRRMTVRARRTSVKKV